MDKAGKMVERMATSPAMISILVPSLIYHDPNKTKRMIETQEILEREKIRVIRISHPPSNSKLFMNRVYRAANELAHYSQIKDNKF